VPTFDAKCIRKISVASALTAFYEIIGGEAVFPPKSSLSF
jgi:hypothetical protein